MLFEGTCPGKSVIKFVITTIDDREDPSTNGGEKK